MQFTKMEGLGNDFVLVDSATEIDSNRVRSLCDRHFGIGADGVLRVGRDGDTIVMDYWNADGGLAEMCGNGLRCVALYAHDRGLVAEKSFQVRTAIGVRRVEVGDLIRVELGPAKIGAEKRWDDLVFHQVSIGNPHLVTFDADPGAVDVVGLGRALELATPGGVNVGFGAATATGIDLRVWERGVGETMACGSGMGAAAAVAHQLGLVGSTVTLRVRGGEATVELNDETTWLTGPARFIFRGELA